MTPKIIADGLLNLLIRRYMGPFWYRRQWLNKTQWLSKEELADVQFNLLKRTIHYAERHVPYYRKLMKNQGFSSEDIRSLEDIKLFPVMTKQDVINADDTILSRLLPKCLLRHAFTGGTTGTPLNLYRSLFSIGNEHAFLRRQWDWAGLKFSDNCAYLKGRLFEKKKRFLYNPIMKELHLSTYHLDIKNANDYLDTIKQKRCKGLVGYPSSVFLLAKANIERKVKLPLKSILLTSETLSRDVRSYISTAFESHVYDFYGAAERACYIFTCEKGSYHIQPEYGFTELHPIDNSGQCRIVSTGFWNLAMPLIRYDTGDQVLVADNTCTCGRQFPMVKEICGRVGDYIKTPTGKMFGVSILTHAFHVICGIDCFVESQIIQDALDHLTVKYIPSKSFKPDRIQEYSIKLKKIIGEEMSIDFFRVDFIEKTYAGKHKFVISKLNQNI